MENYTLWKEKLKNVQLPCDDNLDKIEIEQIEFLEHKPIQTECYRIYDYAYRFFNDEKIKEILGENCYFYISTNTSNNGCAKHLDNNYFLIFFKGKIFDNFKLKEKLINQTANKKIWLDFFELQIIQRDKLTRFDPFDFMFLIWNLFTFYHEVGHFVQFRKGLNDGRLAELQKKIGGFPNHIRHLIETDSDLFASKMLCNHLDFMAKHSPRIAIVSMIGILYLLLNRIDKLEELKHFHDNDKRHPHWFKRTIYVFRNISETVSAKLNLTKDQELKLWDECFIIVEKLFECDKQENKVTNFFTLASVKKEELDRYNESLFSTQEQLLFLCYNVFKY